MPPFEPAGEPPAGETDKERKKREKRERMRELEAFYAKHDLDREYAGLRRIGDEDGTAVWTLLTDPEDVKAAIEKRAAQRRAEARRRDERFQELMDNADAGSGAGETGAAAAATPTTPTVAAGGGPSAARALSTPRREGGDSEALRRVEDRLASIEDRLQGLACSTLREHTRDKQRTAWRETDGIILVYFWATPYVLAAISPFGLWREFFGKILRSVYVTPKKGEKAYIRWEILWILGSLTNTYILMGEASQPERLRQCALTWAVTFTAAALKFAAEKQRGWLEDGGYVTAQLVHLGVALSCYAGYFSSK